MLPSEAFSVDLAITLGGFVSAAYDLFDHGDPANFAPPVGYTLITKLYANDITTDQPNVVPFGFVAQSPIGNDIVVAIRGTDGVLEWLRDFEFGQVSQDPFAGKIEDGFRDFYLSLRTGSAADAPSVVNMLRPLIAGTNKSVHITGHSLGAALATLLAYDVAKTCNGVNPILYTFASPRVGNKVFAGDFDQNVGTSWRIVNLNDIVPHLPPELVGYMHVDAELPINSDDRGPQNVVTWHSLQTYLDTLASAQGPSATARVAAMQPAAPAAPAVAPNAAAGPVIHRSRIR